MIFLGGWQYHSKKWLFSLEPHNNTQGKLHIFFWLSGTAKDTN
jgi:hypothetical protein